MKNGYAPVIGLLVLALLILGALASCMFSIWWMDIRWALTALVLGALSLATAYVGAMMWGRGK